MTQKRVRFGTFAIDSETRELLHGDVSVPLSPTAFDLLAILVAERPINGREKRRSRSPSREIAAIEPINRG